MRNAKQVIFNLFLFIIVFCIVVELQLFASNINRIFQKRVQSVKISGGNENISEEENLIPSNQCQWPPSEIGNIVVNETFNITLCVQSSRCARLLKQERKYTLRKLFGLSKFKGSFTFEDLSFLPRRFWGRMRTPDIYLTYPQDVPMGEIIKAVKRGHPVSEMPDYNFPITILSTPNSTCQRGEKYDLVIVVKSSILAWQARSAFREYMQHEKARNSHMKVGVVFSMGLPRKHGGRIFDREGHLMCLPGPAGDRLEEYDGREAEVMGITNKEIQSYGDILLADYEDTYYNLTWKTVTNYRWMSAFCRAENVKLFMTIDDDHRVNLSAVNAFINRVPEYKRRNSLFGNVAREDYAYRSPQKRLYLSYREFPWDLMYPYLRGFAHFIGPDVVDDIAIATAYTRYNYAPEDVYVGMVAFKLGLPIYHEASMFDHDQYNSLNQTRHPAMVALAKFFPIV